MHNLPSDTERDAQYWRKLEEEASGAAASMNDPEPRRIMLYVAEGYRRLAERADRRETKK